MLHDNSSSVTKIKISSRGTVKPQLEVLKYFLDFFEQQLLESEDSCTFRTQKKIKNSAFKINYAS